MRRLKSLVSLYRRDLSLAPAVAVAERVGFESLEERRLFALLGISSLLNYPDFQSAPPSALTYTAPTGTATQGSLDVATTAVALQTSPTTNVVLQNEPVQGQQIHIKVNKADGSLAGGVPGYDVVLQGDVTIGSTHYSGTLLEGEVSQFGFSSSGNTYEFRASMVGGLLMTDPLYAGQDIGIRVSREAETGVANPQTLPGGFAYNFGGLAKATLGPIAPLVPHNSFTNSLSGHVYVDANNDGLRQPTEQGLNAVPIQLVGTTPDGTVTMTTATSTIGGVDGSYSFTNLPFGTYSVTETSQPTGYLDGQDAPGTVNGVPSGAAQPPDSLVNINLSNTATSNNGVNYDFGEVGGSLSGYVYNDANDNGLFESTEAPIPNTTVSLGGTDDLGNTVTATTTTDANGFYSFPGLRPGTYSITETQPAGFLDGKDTIGTQGGTAGNDVFSQVSLATGVNGQNNNFGELLPSGLSGYVYYDANNDGSRAGETGIPGAVVTLTGTDDLGNSVGTVSIVTAADGSYSFTSLRPGSYTITETQPAGYLDGKDTQGTPGTGTTLNDQFQNITLASGISGTENNFGELLPATLSGYVYYDSNNDGSRAGETGIPGATITLSGTDDLGAPVNAITTTAADGSYSFSGLRPGSYNLAETQPVGYLDGKDSLGTQGGTLSNDLITNATLSSGQSGIENNFGELLPASLSGYVYYDSNNDGSRAGDTGIPGATLLLSGTDDLGNPVSASTATDAYGAYSFAGLRPGSYTINEVQPVGYLDGKDALGTQGGVLGNDVISNAVLASAQNGAENNFGELLPATLSGYVYYDSNDDGSRAGDTGIAGATITLSGTDDLGAPVNAITTTDANGSYSFSGLRPGSYNLAETQPAGYLDGKDALGTQGGVLGNDVISNAVLASAQSGAENNFGELLPASLSGYVYYDSNNDGSRAGETGIPGATITLSGTDDLGAAVNAIATTAADGSYSFSGLRPGSYNLAETQPVGYLDGKDSLGTQGGTLANDLITSATLASGQSGTENNFGELLPASLSGYVYYDSNNDGSRAGDTGIAGATITLTGTDDLGQSVSLFTTTNASGAYSFANLRPGNYQLNETQPSGYLDGKDTIGTPGGVTGNDQFSNIVLNAGVSGTENNFGELLPASLSGYVYYDSNNDGSRAGDTGIPNTTVTLTGVNDLGQSISLVTTTDASGAYSFKNLRPGTYQLNETQPSGYLDGKDTIGAPGGVTSNDQFSNIVLNAGVSGTENNFGEVLPGSLSGFVYLDSNNNGIKESGEAGIPNTTITLTGTDDQGHAVSLTMTTAADGSYSFTNLRPGTYSIAETQPSPYLDGKDTIGTQGGVTSNDLFSQIQLGSGVSGVNNNFGEQLPPPGSLSGYVWVDFNNDGQIDFNETYISGVTITLTGTTTSGGSVSLTTTTDANGYYEFPNLLPGTYSIKEKQPTGYTDGKDSIGTQGGVTSNDLFSKAVITWGQNGIDNNFGELPPAGSCLHGGMTATIGYWQNKNGQALINSLNGGPTSTQLGNWLATTFPNLYGPTCGANNLTNKSNADVASYYLTLFNVKGQKLGAQVLCTALAVYVTNSILAGSVASTYGFTVSLYGTGSATYNVGSYGAAFGVANNTTLTIMQILLDTNNASSNGSLYNGNVTLQNMANTVYNGINTKGDI